VGKEGQERLKSSSILIMGVGGLGSAISLYLAAAGVGKLGIVDCDRVELSNLQRQILHGEEQLGILKVDSAQQKLNALNSQLVVEKYPVKFTPENALDLVRQYDLVVDGSDNFQARYTINDACIKAEKPFVYGAVHGFDGQVSVFYGQKGPCYRCLYPENPEEKGIVSQKPPVLSPLPGVIGSLQAVEALKMLLGVGESLVGYLLVCSLMEGRFMKIAVRRRVNCPSCGGGERSSL
jgi:adenylyltransferase/sulfurtransferase